MQKPDKISRIDIKDDCLERQQANCKTGSAISVSSCPRLRWGLARNVLACDLVLGRSTVMHRAD